MPEFAWLGLSDAAQIRAAAALGCTLLSGDGPLCSAALQRGVDAVHFSSLLA
jgi:predicted nucleic acid-binding protein